MTIISLIVLSTRAAFFNPVIRGRRGKRREKEFEDYKLYMSKFYDTSNWEMHWIPETAKDKFDGDDEDTSSTSGVDVSPSVSEESNPGLVPAVVSSNDGSVFLNLAMRIDDDDDESGEEVGDNNDTVVHEDDTDSDYDSTYSYDSHDDLNSTSTASVFSTIFQTLSQVGRGHRGDLERPNDLQNTSSGSSSVLGRFFPRRAPVSMRSNANISMLSMSSSEKPYAQQVHKSYLNTAFFQEESDEDDSVDSMEGVLLTPPAAARYPSLRPGESVRTQRSRFRVQEDPDGVELERLTPSAQQRRRREERASRQNIRRRDAPAEDRELEPLTPPPRQRPPTRRGSGTDRITEIS